MRSLLFVMLLFLASVPFSPANAQDAKNQNPTHSLTSLLVDLGSVDVTIRQKARPLLKKIVEQLCRVEEYKLPVLGFAFVEGSPPPESKAQRAVWMQEVSDSTPLIRSLLKKASKEDSELLWELLVVGDPDASFLASGDEGLLRDERDCWSFYTTLFSTGAFFAPRDVSVLNSTVQFLDKMTPVQRLNLDTSLRAEGASLFGPTTAGIAIILARADRVQSELESLSKLTQPKHPEVLRLMSLSVLSELGPEARRILPSIKGLLVDKNTKVRLAATFAIASIERESFDVANTATQAHLSEKDKLLLTETFREHVAEADEMNKYVVENLSPKQIEQLLFSAQTNFGKRSILRLAIQLIRNSNQDMRSVRAAIEAELKRGGLDEETKHLARLALSELTSAKDGKQP